MELMALTCKNCNAKLNIRWYPSVVTCEYCGVSYIVKDSSVSNANTTMLDNPVDVDFLPIEHEYITINKLYRMDEAPSEMELVSYAAMSYGAGQKIKLHLDINHSFRRVQEGVYTSSNTNSSYTWKSFDDSVNENNGLQKCKNYCEKLSQLGFKTEIKLENYENEKNEGTPSQTKKLDYSVGGFLAGMAGLKRQCYKREFFVQVHIIAEKIVRPKDFNEQKELLTLLQRMTDNEVTKQIADELVGQLQNKYNTVLATDPNKISSEDRMCAFDVDGRGVSIFSLRKMFSGATQKIQLKRCDFHSYGMKDLGNTMMVNLFKAALASNTIAKSSASGIGWYVSDVKDSGCILTMEKTVEKKYKDW